MRIAILIGVSNYNNLNNLPGCDKDVKALTEIIETSKEFDLIKCFKEKISGLQLKDELTTLFKEIKAQKVSELFFYFTGHGSYHQDDFYYLLSDYDESKRRQTSLQNSEIDNLIKSINPELVVKVVDACQSGISYIKADENIVKKYYQETTSGFKKCYFLHSSMTDQYSYQDNDLSFFTKSFLKSLKECDKIEIRYKDIIDFISDEFETVTQQTPFFVTQADFTENFIDSSNEIRQILSKYVVIEDDELPSKISEQASVNFSFIDLIKKDAQTYVSEEEVKTLLGSIKEKLENHQFEPELAELFECKIFTQTLYDLPNRLSIGTWLKDNQHDYFAAPTYDEVAYDETSTPAFRLSISDMLANNRTTTRYKKVISGYDLTADVPFKSLSISLLPKFANLFQYTCLICFFTSKREIKFFYSFTNYKDKSWTNRDINTNFTWNSAQFLIQSTEDILNFVDDISNNFTNYVLDFLKKTYEVRSL